MKSDINNIEDAKIKALAIEIYDVLSTTGMLAVFEILVNDIYGQIGQDDSFSVEIRANEAEFFLFDMNFSVSKDGDFESFRRDILTIVRSVLAGDYEIEVTKFGDKVVHSYIIFSNNVRVRLYKSILYSVLSAFSSRFKTYFKKGEAIVK
jgi:hypothetical protein